MRFKNRKILNYFVLVILGVFLFTNNIYAKETDNNSTINISDSGISIENNNIKREFKITDGKIKNNKNY
ncbi:hypothetical protein ACWOAQ_06120 [Helcococcus kunzii]